MIEEGGKNKYFLETMTRFKPFTLTELEERMINLKDVNGIDAMMGLYEMLTNQFSFELEIEGKTETLTRDQLSGYFSSASAEMREKAYQSLFKVYTENSTAPQRKATSV